MPRYLDSTACLTSPFNLGIVVDENRIGGVAEVQEGGLVPSFHLGKPEGIVSTVLGGKIPEVEKLRRARDYCITMVVMNCLTGHPTYFTRYYLDMEKEQTLLQTLVLFRKR